MDIVEARAFARSKVEKDITYRHLVSVEGVMRENITNKLAWRLAEIFKATGISISQLRNEARRGALVVRRRGRMVYVLDEDLRRYLEGETEVKTEGEGCDVHLNHPEILS